MDAVEHLQRGRSRSRFAGQIGDQRRVAISFAEPLVVDARADSILRQGQQGGIDVAAMRAVDRRAPRPPAHIGVARPCGGEQGIHIHLHERVRLDLHHFGNCSPKIDTKFGQSVVVPQDARRRQKRCDPEWRLDRL
jgi:hypothetical protein